MTPCSQHCSTHIQCNSLERRSHSLIVILAYRGNSYILALIVIVTKTVLVSYI